MVQPSQQHVTPCVRGVEIWIWHERFENSGSVLGQHPGLFSLDCRGYTEGKVYPV